MITSELKRLPHRQPSDSLFMSSLLVLAVYLGWILLVFYFCHITTGDSTTHSLKYRSSDPVILDFQPAEFEIYNV